MKKLLILVSFVVSCSFFSYNFVFAQNNLIDEEGDNTQTCADIRQTIRYGDIDSRLGSNSVALLQDFLIDRGYLRIQGGAPNGYFGNATLRAVKAFQTAAGIKPTGTVGLATRIKIKAVDCQGQAIAYNPRTTTTTNTNTNTTNTNTTNNTTNTNTTNTSTTTNTNTSTATTTTGVAVVSTSTTSSSARQVTIIPSTFAWNVIPTVLGQSRGVTEFGFSISKNGSRHNVTGKTIVPLSNGAWAYRFPSILEPGTYVLEAYDVSSSSLGRGEIVVNDPVGGCANPPVIQGPNAYVGVPYTFNPGVTNYSVPYPSLPRSFTKENGIIKGTATTTGEYSVKISADNSCQAIIVRFKVVEGLRVKQIAQTTTSATYEIIGPSEILQKASSCTYSQGFFGTSGNGLDVNWGDATTPEPGKSYTTAKRGTSCTNAVKKHTYTKTGRFVITANSWHPGPTDIPVYDWNGSTTITVAFAAPVSAVPQVVSPQATPQVTVTQEGGVLPWSNPVISGTAYNVPGGSIKIMVYANESNLFSLPLTVAVSASGAWAQEIRAQGGVTYRVVITDINGNVLKEARFVGESEPIVY